MQKDLTVPELKQILEQNGFSSDGQKLALQQRCKQANLPTSKAVQKIVEGYIGKAKGGAEIGFERGFWDRNLKLPNGKTISMGAASSQRRTERRSEILQQVLGKSSASAKIPKRRKRS